MRTLFFAVVMVGGAVAVGCGGIGDAENLFSESVGGATPGATTSAGGASPTSSTGPGATTHTSTTGPGPTVTATSTTTTTGPSTTGPTTTTTTVSSTGAHMAQSSSATSTVAVTVSSSSTGTGPTITCGVFNCPTNGGGACCSNIFDQPASTSCVSTNDPTECDNRPDQSGFNSLITCDAPMDCPGQTCCGHLVFAGGGDFYDTVSCQSSCDYNSGDITLCDPSRPDQGQCPVVDDMQGNQTQSHCTQSSLLPMGYFVCTT